jgi:NCS1 family nucleobase:cation symporter-1
MSNTLPLRFVFTTIYLSIFMADDLSAAITTRDLIGFFIYFLFYFPIVFYVPLHKLQRYLYPSVIITAVTFIGMLAWALKQNGGTGPLVSSSVQLTSLEKAFMFLQCASGNAATWGGGGDRLSDWTRYSKKRHSSTPAILTALPVMLTLTSIVGVLVTSAFYQMYGQEIWTPLGMLLYVQEVQYTPACRAGTFFAGIGLLSSQIYINIVQNTVAFGMDFAGMFPK